MSVQCKIKEIFSFAKGIFMAEILKEGPRLRLRRAEAADIDYICTLQEAKDNSDYIVPFSRADHETIVAQSKAAMDIIVEERSGGSIGYLHIAGLLASFEVSPALPHRRQGVAAAQVRGGGLRTGNQQPLPLLLADHSLLGVGGIRGLSTRIGHVRGVYRHQTTKSRR